MARCGDLPDRAGVIFNIPEIDNSTTFPAMKTEPSIVPEVLALEHCVQSSNDPSVHLHLRERRPIKISTKNKVPLLLVHGATIPSVLWDNPLPNWSWMDRLAMDGFHVFAVDLRGYGQSSRPECFERPPLENKPYARAKDVEQDVIDTIGFILDITGTKQVDLLGGSWGAIICGKLVAENPEIKVRRLVLYAPLYSEMTTRPDWLDRPNISSIGAYRRVSPEQLRLRWDREIPVQNKLLWRPEGVLEALMRSCIAADKGTTRVEQSHFRVPNGTIADLLEVFDAKPLYNSADISVPTLLIRGSADPVSTHDDTSRLFASLSSNIKRYTVIGNGAHFMIAENKINEVHSSIAGFLTENFEI